MYDGAWYYGSAYYHPNSQSRYTAMSLMDLMAFDAKDHADLIDQPLLMMVGDVADTRYMTEGLFEKATGTDDKKLVLIEGASHIEAYWKPEYVDAEEAELKAFFVRTLQALLRACIRCMPHCQDRRVRSVSLDTY